MEGGGGGGVTRQEVFSENRYLTIFPRARMGSESIAHEAEWAIDSEAMRAKGIIVLVKSN